MYKKSIATALLVCSVPALASASWFLSTQVRSGGGSLTTRNMTGQKVTDGAVFHSYTAGHGALSVSATPSYGFTLQSLTVDGTAIGNPASVAINGSDQNIVAVFTPTGFDVLSNGTPSRVGGVYSGYKLSSPVTFTFTPAAGYAISAINTASIPVDRVKNFDAAIFKKDSDKVLALPALPGAANTAVKVTLPAGYIFTDGFNLSASQLPVAATLKGGAGHLTTLVATPANLSAVLTQPSGATTSYTYNWTLVSGPQNTRVTNTDSNGNLVSSTGSAYGIVAGPALSTMSFTQNTGSGAASFIPAVAGQYKLLLSATPNDGSAKLVAMVTVNAAASVKDANENSCQFCHSANNIRTADTSSHASCQSCHFEGAGHPGSVSAGTVNSSTFVVGSDNVANGNGTTVAKGTSFCASCHGVSGNAAQAVPALTTHQDKACSDCHASAHDTHVASAACQTCHAAVHTSATMGTSACLDCHDGHKPTFGTKPLVGSVSHPAVTLYTFEEIGYQMNGGQPVPVQVDANGKGMPYSPKTTCGTSGCHVINGVNYTYDRISDHAFHSAQGRNEFQDSADGKLDARKNKPWGQSSAMVGKW
jgi:hypothetical protein